MLQEKRIKQIKYVVENSKYVKLNKEKLEKWADEIKGSIFNEHPWSQYKSVFTEKEIIILFYWINEFLLLERAYF